jgi:hypothetical protein
VYRAPSRTFVVKGDAILTKTTLGKTQGGSSTNKVKSELEHVTLGVKKEDEYHSTPSFSFFGLLH